jgi:hypothetical protein
MKVTITSMEGTTKSIDLPTRDTVERFISGLPLLLNQNHRVKVTCDLLGIDGYIQGKVPTR